MSPTKVDSSSEVLKEPKSGHQKVSTTKTSKNSKETTTETPRKSVKNTTREKSASKISSESTRSEKKKKNVNGLRGKSTVEFGSLDNKKILARTPLSSIIHETVKPYRISTDACNEIIDQALEDMRKKVIAARKNNRRRSGTNGNCQLAPQDYPSDSE